MEVLSTGWKLLEGISNRENTWHFKKSLLQLMDHSDTLRETIFHTQQLEILHVPYCHIKESLLQGTIL